MKEREGKRGKIYYYFSALLGCEFTTGKRGEKEKGKEKNLL